MYNANTSTICKYASMYIEKFNSYTYTCITGVYAYIIMDRYALLYMYISAMIDMHACNDMF